MYAVSKFLVIIIVGCCARVCSSQCRWNVKKDFAEKEPIYYTSKNHYGHLLIPVSKEGLDLQHNEEFRILCAGSKNFLSGKGINEVVAVCDSGKFVRVEGNTLPLNKVACTKENNGEVVQENKSCAGRKGRLLSIGYQSTEGWLKLFEVCYDYTRSITLYSQHVINGAAIEGAYVGNQRPSFKTSGLPSNISLTKAYKQINQRDRFVDILGESKTNLYINKTSFLSRGHLAPDADFIFRSWQSSTYFYANVVPQWQAINVGNWVRLENAVRKLAQKRNENLNIWTGSEGTLELEDDNNNYVRMFLLEKNTLPIPKFMWKVVCTEETDQCIAFVVLNNPFARQEEQVCQNICKDTNWYLKEYENISKGYLVCCEIRDLNSTLGVIPTINVEGVLHFTS